MASTTKIRVIETSNESYNFLEIQILEESSNGNLMGTFYSIGSITFQQNKGETEWYGMRYVTGTSRFEELDAFTRLAKTINKMADHKSQPDEIINIINGKRYYIYNQEFFKESDKGKFCFMVKRNSENYSRMIAKDEKEATKKLNEFLKSRKGHWFNNDNYTFSVGDKFIIQ